MVGLETELRLGLPGGGGGGGEVEKNEKKRVFSDICGGEDKAAEGKNPMVGWPPVAAFRQKNSFGCGKIYVKVSMDGAPFLRKIDLSMNKGYGELAKAIEELFGCFGIGEALKEKEEINCEYVPIYEDKDGDWMLLGDVPWGMFMESCKRLRIMRRADANGVGLHAKDLLKGLSKEE
ncbi:hypothetical protein CDL12_29179 [Handroanthus impetiginosus]|uniref:Auxin-responsive protein n=1 Tax=Handroanthus impetiginosus TaxID=429701 RepID=A0A2G9FZ67_9LAMI|nr:hypothetical protein CDL12_29179 [Handroanthus impetiginosus]